MDSLFANTMTSTVTRPDLIQPELSYKIVGALFSVYNALGPGHHEKYYQRAMASAFRGASINFKEQFSIPLKFNGAGIGRYQLDFLVEEKVVLELKKGDKFSKRNIDQVLQYLKSSGLQLAILANFSSDKVSFKRIVNFDIAK